MRLCRPGIAAGVLAFLMAGPFAWAAGTEDAQWAALFTKAEALFERAENITPPPNELEAENITPPPNELEAENITPPPNELEKDASGMAQGRCVKREHHYEVFPLGVTNRNQFSAWNAGGAPFSHAPGNPLEAPRLSYEGKALGFAADSREYRWEDNVRNNYGGELSSFRLRRVRSKTPSSVDEYWVSHYQWRLSYKDLVKDTYCFYW